MTNCPAPDVIAAFAAGELTAESRAPVELHVSRCDSCLETVGYLTSQASRSEPAAAARFALACAEQAIGPYRLIRKIGEGGMGEVWQAQQISPVRRTVALKLLKAGMDTRQIVTRFEAERQVLALMQHPGIAQVFDAGITEAGRPYFVMELVEGAPITAYCDRANLSVRDRLELFQQVCEAVQHAHQKGVIHRDIKPSNVLIATQGSKPLPKVIDFGLAKAITGELKDASFTEFGTLLGTPAYASPEQMSLGAIDIDTRSDVYSLGTLLYELLAGVIPFEAPGTQPLAMMELRRTIRELEPARPSARLPRLGDRESDIARARGLEPQALRKQLRGDLDWIVMKALEKERERRYASPRELSLDIDRYLNHEPLQAGPPTTAYRVRKYVRRHRIATAFAATISTVVIAFVVVTILQSQRIAEERDRATAEAAKATSINAFLQETLGSADPWQTGKDISIREVLANAATKAEAELEDQPLIAAAVKNTIGVTYLGLGQLDDAERLLTEAMQVRKELLGPRHIDVAEGLTKLAELEQVRGDLEQSAQHARDALDLYREHFGESHEQTARAMTLHARQLLLQGEVKEAKPLAERALAILENRFGAQSVQLLQTLEVLGRSLSLSGDFPRAEATLTRAVDVARRGYGVENVQTSVQLINLGALYYRSGRPAEAVPLYSEVLQVQLKVLGPRNPLTLITKENLAGSLINLRRYDEALELLGEVLAGRKETLGENAAPVARTMINIARLHAEAGRLEESIRLYEIALPRFASAYGIDHADNALLQVRFARVLRQNGQGERAESLLREELTRQPSRIAANDTYRADVHQELGALLAQRGVYDEAEEHLLAAQSIHLKISGADQPRTQEIAKLLAQLHADSGKPAQQ